MNYFVTVMTSVVGAQLKTDNEAAEEILEFCIDQWITVRENSFANFIASTIYKQQSKKGTEKAKSLCKILRKFST